MARRSWDDPVERQTALARNGEGYRYTAREVAAKLGRTIKSVERFRERNPGSIEVQPDPIPPAPAIPPPPPRKPRRVYPPFNPFMQPAAVFDIETTDFKTTGRKGYLLCCSILELEAELPYTVQIEFGELSDERVLSETIEALSQYSIVIGHNASSFDLGWLNSRRMYHDMPIMPSWRYFDTYMVAKTIAVKSENKSMATLVDFFGLHGIKTAVYADEWNEVRSPDPEYFHDTMARIVYHCEQDVLANRQLFYALWPDSLRQRNNQLKRTKW